jgi:hypothetical protein
MFTICIGAHFAETNIFLNISSILATFNISKPVAEDGRELQPEMSYAFNGVVSFVINFLYGNDRFKLIISLVTQSSRTFQLPYHTAFD